MELRICDHLEKNGYAVLERNFTGKFGEIDIIATDGKYICFVEVKYRKDLRTGFPEEAVGIRKIRRICKTAAYYLSTHRQYASLQMRFDVASILGDKLSYYENAFDYII